MILDEDFQKPAAEADRERYLTTYFGRGAEFYLEKYQAFHAGHRFTFNIGSFLAGMFWFMYRKLYIPLIIVIAILFVIGVAEELIFQLIDADPQIQRIIDTLMNLVSWFAFGFCGNYIYLKQADKNIDKILSATIDEEQRLDMLTKKGGVSNSPFIALGIIFILILIYFFS